MNGERLPCVHCDKFDSAAHHCPGYDRPQQPDGQQCVLFLKRGSAEARLAARSSAEMLVDLGRRHPKSENFSRASAPTAAPT